MLGEHLLHGGDYNPEQWIEHPEILEEDISLMKKAKVNCVTLGIFSWAVLEPEEGVYHFEWLENIVDSLGENGIQVILATPSGAMPHWLTQKYPEVLQTGSDGKHYLSGQRHNFCYTSPVLKEKILALDEKLSEVFGRKESVILWHISNELGNFGNTACHCEHCQKEFRRWLQKKYKTLDHLNQVWWGRFWSHVYTDWNQIHSPVAYGECSVTGLELDWKRFVTEQVSKFCGLEVQAVKRHSDCPVTTNLMEFFKNLDYNRLKEEIDLISWDSYPRWHIRYDEVPEAVRTAAMHSIMRSLKKQSFLLMESTPSQTNWRDYNPLKRPGMHMLSSMQAIAHGSDSVQYFQWRKSRGGYEKFHGAVIDHKYGSDTRTYRDVMAVGERLEKLNDDLNATLNHPKAAIIFDWENWWAVEETTGPRLDWDYVECVLSHYQAFWEYGIEVDFIDMTEDLSDYQMIAAPLNYMYKEGYADRIRKFVFTGGIFVTTYFSGNVDENDLCFMEHHPLMDVLGIEPEEVDAPSKEFPNYFVYEGKSYPATQVCEVVRRSENTKVLAVYEKDFYRGYPVVTEHCYGRGKAFYVATKSDGNFLKEFYGKIFQKCGLQNVLGVELPYGITTTERSDKNGNSIVFVMNFRNESVTIKEIGNWKNVETGELYNGKVDMKAFECILLRK